MFLSSNIKVIIVVCLFSLISSDLLASTANVLPLPRAFLSTALVSKAPSFKTADPNTAEPKTQLQKSEYFSNETCVGCHSEQHQQWSKSDHAKSMAIANSSSVIADFNNTTAEHYGQKSLFFIENGKYFVTVSYNDKLNTYPVQYTFGHYPLQQYLVETETGRFQVLPFAWDSRTKEQGGQRWYHNYSHEEIRPEDRLHWRQPLQNWNGMCADCHSDGLVRNFDSNKNQFASQFDNINVGCYSCHGDMSEHIQYVQQKPKRNVANDITSVTHPTGLWLRKLGEKTAHWQGPKRDNSFMDNCHACHSLRSPLTDGITPKKAFLDQFSPQLIAAPNYHADGQIKEEVYVYGSFLQSKMFTAGVNCLDCHDKHTMKLNVEGNGLCAQCHSPQVFDNKSHHQHPVNSAGAQCVNCHMPSNRYMGVDDRRDHSFKIPRPHLSDEFNTPNACVGCHTDQSNTWAANNLKKWHGKVNALPASKQIFIKLQSGHAIGLNRHLALIADEQVDIMTRATALQSLSYTTQLISPTVLSPYIDHSEPLMRLAAARVGVLISPTERFEALTPLLKDKYKAIRVAAANSLIDLHTHIKNNSLFIKSFDELIKSNELSTWRGEGNLNKGVMAMQINEVSQAVNAFKAAINVEPYMDIAYINLADVYRTQQNPAKVKETLDLGVKNIPTSDSIQYAYGLYLVRQKQLSAAINYIKKAMELDKTNSRYLYTYALALDGLGKTRQGLNLLKARINSYQDKSQLVELGLYFGQKLRDKQIYDWFQNIVEKN